MKGLKFAVTLLVGGLLTILATSLYQFPLEAWAAVWNVANMEGAAGIGGAPTNASVAANIDDFIRHTRQEVRYRAEVEHFWGPGDGLNDDNGLHRIGSARCFVASGAPTELSDSHSGVGGGTIADYDNSVGTQFSGEPDLNNPATNSAAGDEDDIGTGRCWFDTDDNKFYIYEGVAGAGGGAWSEASAIIGTEVELDDEVLAGAYNLIYNGSFEAADGTGDATSTTVPAGWADGGTVCVHGYNDPSTDDDYGDGYEYECSGAGGANALITQTLTNLAANQVYKVIARAMDDGTTVCRLSSTGASVDTGNIDTTTDVWETLEGTFTTAAALDTVAIQLTRVTDNQVCLWDHVAVYRIGDVTADRPEVSQPGIQRVRATYAAASGALNCGATYAAAGCLEAQTGLSVIVNPPGPGYIISLSASLDLEVEDAGDSSCEARLYDATTPVQLDEAFFKTITAGGVGIHGNESSVSLGATVINPTPGTPVTYQIDIREPDADCQLEDTVDSWIEALLIPTR